MPANGKLARWPPLESQLLPASSAARLNRCPDAAEHQAAERGVTCDGVNLGLRSSHQVSTLIKAPTTNCTASSRETAPSSRAAESSLRTTSERILRSSLT